ncbi:MAG TPA: PQQ-binding-like beta-propeller repeat protein [Vicinamibacteria bacterium]|nr:PQQ-binding-like beta-propeller repeat protein [Vicinamibacteria bacterium]
MKHSLETWIGILLTLWASAAAGENWPQWRGPTADGVSPEKNLPLHWSSTLNILWKASLPGRGTSSPIVQDELVFVTLQLGSGPIDGRGAEFPEAVAPRADVVPTLRVTLVVRALDRRDGHTVWEHRLDAGDKNALPAVHPKHNLASPSVVTDGESVFAWMGTGQVLALDLRGNLRWEKDFARQYGPFDVLWGHGSSPALYRDRIYLLCDHPRAAYLVALNKSTGEEIWRVERGEGIRSYTTPLVVRGPGGDELIVNGSDRIESYDLMDGKSLWHAGEPVTLAIPIPVHREGVLYASRGYSSGPYSAIRLGGRGDVSKTHVLWHVPTSAPYVSSLLLYDGLLYMATERGVVSAVDPESGKTVWRKRLGAAFTASPVAGDGKVFFLDEAGDAFVLRAGPRPELLARNPIEERTLASPAISGQTIFVRTDHHVFAIGKK